MTYSNLVTGFTKLFSGIVFSTVWQEPMHVRVVWVTMLALANRNGDVLVSLPGLAKASGATMEQTEEALATFQSPDPHSRTKTKEGRRVEEIDGGWWIINYGKYRELRDQDERRIKSREAVRKHRASNRSKQMKSDVIPVSKSKHIAEAEADAEAEAEKKTSPAKAGGKKWLGVYLGIWNEYGGSVTPGHLAKALKPAHDAVADPSKLAYGLGKWLAAGNAKYGPEVFARDWRKWVPGGRNGTPDAGDLDMAEWVAEQEAKDAP